MSLGWGAQNRMKTYKVMAYVKSTGLWDAFGHISLEALLGYKNRKLEASLQQWHAAYDDQFKQYPYDFDWKQFNAIGKELTSRIKTHLPPGTDVYYEPSDDREFFSRKDCTSQQNTRDRELSLRERKRALLYSEVGKKES